MYFKLVTNARLGYFCSIYALTLSVFSLQMIWSSSVLSVCFLYHVGHMLRELHCSFPVEVCLKNLDQNGGVLGRTIVNSLLKLLSDIKATKFGYFLAVTKLKSIGNGHRVESCLHFQVKFCCRTFIPVCGEVMIGIVKNITVHGVYLKSGPMNLVYLSARLMPNYHYVSVEHPIFLKDDLSKIEVNVVIRFRVFAVRWVEDVRKEFHVLATINGESLGPVSSTQELDGLDL